MTRLTATKFIAALAVSALGASFAHAQSMTVTSAEIKEGATIANEQVFKGFGCTGGNVSPSLSWSGAPAATKSFAVSIYDPDA
ncbi:MAG TPA: phosphatidylethanolamine-binding protein, partial [Bradyrhizobium sp.]|nr:phosphatidylethanolamine-binding protein [Bradyrhizobium sp.]